MKSYKIINLDLWNKHSDAMSEDFAYKLKKQGDNINQKYVINQTLLSIEDECISINNKMLKDFGIPSPNRNCNSIEDQEYQKEINYNINDLTDFLSINEPKLNQEQRKVYETIMYDVQKNNGGIYFLDAPGGTGKTFLLNIILAKIRLQKYIAIAVASSGIAATLLEGGRTAHSTFKLPLNIHQIEEPTCNLKKNSSKLQL